MEGVATQAVGRQTGEVGAAHPAPGREGLVARDTARPGFPEAENQEHPLAPARLLQLVGALVGPAVADEGHAPQHLGVLLHLIHREEAFFHQATESPAARGLPIGPTVGTRRARAQDGGGIAGIEEEAGDEAAEVGLAPTVLEEGGDAGRGRRSPSQRPCEGARQGREGHRGRRRRSASAAAWVARATTSHSASANSTSGWRSAAAR